MSGLGGVLTGTLALAAFEALLTTSHGQAVSDILAVPGGIARWWMDPTKPLIPDRRTDAVKKLENQLGDAYSKAGTQAPTGGTSTIGGGGSTGGGGITPIPSAPPKSTPPIIAI